MAVSLWYGNCQYIERFWHQRNETTHLGIIDSLACKLIDGKWSLKNLHRHILTSKTWQQASHPRVDQLKIDASTRYLWRFPPRRLDAEPIRDSIVSVSGVLNPKKGGPGFSGFAVEKENVRHYFPRKTFGPNEWRRMIYMTKIRQEREATFGVFDCPDGGQVIPQRSRSTTPLQALNLFNSAFIQQQASLFAKRLETEAIVHAAEKIDVVEAQIKLAYQLCYSREPSIDESKAAVEFVQKNDLTQFCRALLNSNEFLFIP